MDLKNVLTWVTPLMYGALIGLYNILHGLYYTLNGTPRQRQDYPLEIIVGVPILLGCLLAHLLIRRLTNQNPLYIWIIEIILAIPFRVIFYPPPW